MINIFRKIRRDLLAKGDSVKYLKYAIGEIVFVVIGILFALQINNWNEGRKSMKNTEHLLKQVQKELAFNIEKANHLIRSYRQKNSLVYRVLNQEVSYEDYKSNAALSHLLLSQEAVEISSEAFLNLINNQDTFSQEQDDIVLNLKELYGTNKKRVDLTDEITTANVLENHKRFKNEKTWYYDYLIQEEIPDKMIQYCLMDSLYLNNVASFHFFNLRNHNRYSLIFRNKAIDLYEDLSNYLKLTKDTAIIKHVTDYTHYLGKYTGNNNTTCEIIQKKEKLIYTWKNNAHSTISEQFVIYPSTKTNFTVDNSFGKFIYDENQNVTGFTLSLGSSKSKFIKSESLDMNP